MCFDTVTTATYEEMVRKATEKLAKDYEVYKAAQEAKQKAEAEAAAAAAVVESSSAAPADEGVAQNGVHAEEPQNPSPSNAQQNGLPPVAESESDSSGK